MDASTYEATYRRSEVAIPALLGAAALFGVGMYLVVAHVPGHAFEAAIAGVAGSMVVVMILLLLWTFRVHRWAVEADGIRIAERPKVPLLGLRRRAVVAFADIIGFRRIEVGFDRQLEIITTAGRSYRLAARPGDGLDAFAAQIRAMARRAGRELPATSEGLSFWNRLPGIAVIVVMLVISCAIAGATGWALLDGMTMSPGARSGYGAAIALLLPFGCGYLLLKAVRRRRAVLASLRR